MQHLDGSMREVYESLIKSFNTSGNIIWVGTDDSQETGPSLEEKIERNLVENKSQISITALYPKVRSPEIDQTSPLHYNTWNIMSMISSITLSHQNAILDIFTIELWKMILICFLLFSIVSVTLQRARYKLIFTRRQSEQKPLWDQVISNSLSAFSVFFFKSVFVSRRQVDRLLWIGWIICAYTLALAYSGCLLSKLTWPNTPFRANNLKDVLGQPGFFIKLFRNTQIELIFRESETPVVQDVYRGVLRDGNLFETRDLDIGSVFETRVDSGFPVGKDEYLPWMGVTCDMYGSEVYMGTEDLFMQPLVILFRRDFNQELTRKLRRVVHGYVESGIYTKILKKINFLGDLCLKGFWFPAEPDQSKPLCLTSLKFTFLMFLTGILVSSASFSMEIILSKIKALVM